jgi:hypothetical protein
MSPRFPKPKQSVVKMMVESAAVGRVTVTAIGTAPQPFFTAC